ncbi:MAG: LysE family transporter [Planctomycetes bacterium]|nr:LysE family transporter [Planctomycetota bacterium]
MPLDLLWKGLVLGFSIAGPVGPIGLLNPMTILSFAAAFAGLGAVSGAEGDRLGAGLLVLGVFCASALWWLLLSGAVGLARSRVTPRSIRWVSRVSGAAILGFGAAALAGAFSGVGV